MSVSHGLIGYYLTDKKMDTDDPEHIAWLYKTAVRRAQEFNIEGVTWPLTQGVIKNIIPAIASTNAIIAGKDAGIHDLISMLDIPVSCLL